jgi:hypothetical protein
MPIFASEAALLEVIRIHDQLLESVASGELDFCDFCEKYNDFYAFYALDGHESDAGEQAWLEKYNTLIEPHRVVYEDILSLVCSDDDAKREIYKQAGRIGSFEAVRRIKLLLKNAGQ